MRAVPEEEAFADLWRLRICRTNPAQQRIGGSSSRLPVTIEWEQVATTGTAPCARHSHAAVAFGAYGLLIVGGSSAAHQPLGDLFLCHTGTNVWLQLEVAILPREMACAVVRTNSSSTTTTARPASLYEVTVAGGRTTGGALLSDAVILDIEDEHNLTEQQDHHVVVDNKETYSKSLLVRVYDGRR